MYGFSETQVSIEVRSNWGPHTWHLRSRQPSWLILHTVYLGRLYSSSRNNGASMLDLCMESLRDRHSMTMLSQTPQMHCSHLLACFISQTCLGYILSNFANLSIIHIHIWYCVYSELSWVESQFISLYCCVWNKFVKLQWTEKWHGNLKIWTESNNCVS